MEFIAVLIVISTLISIVFLIAGLVYEKTKIVANTLTFLLIIIVLGWGMFGFTAPMTTKLRQPLSFNKTKGANTVVLEKTQKDLKSYYHKI